LPPAGSFDVRFSSGRIAEDINSSFQSIELTSMEYPVTVKVENAEIRLMDETRRIINLELKSGEEVTIDNSTISKLMVSGEQTVKEFSLEQNYPNPFNPSTKIRFTIPSVIAIRQLPEKQSQTVTLKVFDVLGNEVTTLVNEEKAEGSYEVEFNAANYSSGIYFYRLQAGSFVETKKMILLR
jgi:hypothetical protein